MLHLNMISFCSLGTLWSEVHFTLWLICMFFWLVCLFTLILWIFLCSIPYLFSVISVFLYWFRVYCLHCICCLDGSVAVVSLCIAKFHWSCKHPKGFSISNGVWVTVDIVTSNGSLINAFNNRHYNQGPVPCYGPVEMNENHVKLLICADY